ncbi:acetate--CoA ligase family protein [Halorubrum ezzemoulense]|uniref:acetate--CoA ligase family protein n=1 Tax=Halorubrum ezzemoulense TaxID=337243 RepID=UPI00232A990E|nr:acetate--CoA ligase [Halorubrum ezzemoulense]MDB9281461.1 acetate--CoA ligase family protein [Halorubrum ezzemoulense]MDB9284991.1 acetate--CoA ligase family protein [Halorubrum ezzemoulense]
MDDQLDNNELPCESVSGPDLDPLFDPGSVAVVGASPDSFYSGNLAENLLEYGFDGTLYPVNPGRDKVWGRQCYDDISDVPEAVDLVVVSVPREYVVDVVESAGERDIPVALVLTAGFSEADETGTELESELAATAEEAGIRVVGPNCIGVMASEGATLTSTCSRNPRPGGIGLVSQSGALAFTTFFERAADNDIHFSHIVSTGNEVDLTTADYVAYLADQDEVDVICTYIEGVEEPERFLRVAEAAVRSGTPVLAVKIGSSELSEAATLSHTGSLTGDDDAWEAAFDQTGIERVPDIPDLLSRASAHTTYGEPDGDSICVASTSGGLASLLADLAAERDLSLPDIEGETERTLLDIEELLTYGGFNNPADIRGYGAHALPEIASSVLDDDSFDAYVFAIGLPGVDKRAETIAADLERIAAEADDPVYVLWTGRKEPEDPTETPPYARLRKSIPVYEDPSRCMDAVASTIDFVATRDRLADQSPRETLVADTDGPIADLPDGRVLTWAESESLLDAYGIPVVETHLATNADEAAAAAGKVGFPAVLKVDSPALPHRTDAGAVRLNIDSSDAARRAYEEVMDAALTAVDVDEIEGVLVQPMVDDGVEAIAGVTPDDVFGSLVSVGPGGVLVEAFDDAATLVPPFSCADARAAVEDTTLAALLRNRREGPAPGIGPFVDFLVHVGDLAAETDAVSELDLNPVVVTAEGPVAVDALVRTHTG